MAFVCIRAVVLFAEKMCGTLQTFEIKKDRSLLFMYIQRERVWQLVGVSIRNLEGYHA